MKQPTNGRGRRIRRGYDADAYLFKKDEDIIYYNMAQNIQIEKTAPLKSTFYSFCKMAGYLACRTDINLDVDIELESILESIDISYSTIKDISYNESVKLVNNIACGDATSLEKVEVRKYFFKKHFIDETAEEIEYAWDKKYNKFFLQMEKLSHKQDITIFEMIRAENKWDSIFPETKQLNKVKLSEKLIDVIFDMECWSFTRLKKTSGAKVLLRTIYNTWFGKTVIESKLDDNKNSTLSIDDDIVDMYNFGLENLKAFNTSKANELNIYEPSPLDAGIDQFLD